MATQITQIFPRLKHECEKSRYTRNRKVAVMECHGKQVRFENDGRGGRGGHGGRGGRGNNRNKNYLNGVDVSDPSRSFSPEEWQKLRDGNHVKYIISMRDKAARRGGRGGQGGRGKACGGRGKRNISSTTQDDSDQQESNKGSQNGSSFGRGSHKDNQES